MQEFPTTEHAWPNHATWQVAQALTTVDFEREALFYSPSWRTELLGPSAEDIIRNLMGWDLMPPSEIDLARVQWEKIARFAIHLADTTRR